MLDLQTAVDTALAALNGTEPSDGGLLNWLKSAVHPEPLVDLPFKGTLVTTLHKGFVGVRDRWIVAFEEVSPGVIRASMSDIELRRTGRLHFEAGDTADLARQIEAWRAKIDWWAGRLTTHRLQPGRAYRILQTFQDFQRQTFEAGTVQTFQSQNFVPYHGGYTLFFDRPMYFQEDENADILENFDLYFAEAQPE